VTHSGRQTEEKPMINHEYTHLQMEMRRITECQQRGTAEGDCDLKPGNWTSTTMTKVNLVRAKCLGVARSSLSDIGLVGMRSRAVEMQNGIYLARNLGRIFG
jgi:Tfp pilus assembly protein PilP